VAQDLVHEITLWAPDLGSDLTPVGDAIWDQILRFKTVEKLGEVERATFEFARGAALPLDTVMTERTVFKVQYGRSCGFVEAISHRQDQCRCNGCEGCYG
jgi:hypothetical protein